jgi:23S rRNA pseudouridine1911/1915/1917 synthase
LTLRVRADGLPLRHAPAVGKEGKIPASRQQELLGEKAPASWVRPGPFRCACAFHFSHAQHAVAPVHKIATMPRTLFDWLVERFPTAKKQNLKRMAAAGRVMVNSKPVLRLDVVLSDSDQVAVADRAPVAKVAPSGKRRPDGAGVLDIVHEDADVLVVNKPAGLLTSTNPGEKRPTLLAQVREHVASQDPRARVGLIHRLDRDASGLLVFSKNDPAYHALKTQFFHHDVERVYLAVVAGIPNPPAGRIRSRLVERADGTVYSTEVPGKGQVAETHYETVRANKDRRRPRALLRVTLHTGRKHQIRVHLSERGWPIVGDRVYNEAAGAGPDGTALLLAAVRLAIVHPRTGEKLVFERPMPPAFKMAVSGEEEGAKPEPRGPSRV